MKTCKQCGNEYVESFFPLVKMHYDKITKKFKYQYRRKICRTCYSKKVMSYRKLHKDFEKMNNKDRLEYIKNRYKYKMNLIEERKKHNDFNILGKVIP